MSKNIITKVAIILLVTINPCWACICKKSTSTCQTKTADTNSVDTILKQLKQKTKELESYQCRIEYLFSQPLFESKTLRNGDLFYAKYGKKSKLRINFQTIKQDDEKEQKHIEQYIILDGTELDNVNYKFEGIWLVRINYPIKTVEYHQLAEAAEPNESADAFDLVSRNFPIVGFAQASDLKKEFEIKLVEQKEAEQPKFIQLHLKVKPDSTYKDDYTTIDFWIDKELYLPTKIVATSTEDDIYQIKFVKPKVNKKLNKKVFDFKIPKGFDKPEIIPLKRKAKQK